MVKAKRIVIKIGTSSITYANGNINLKKMEQLARVIADLQNSGKEIVLVSSGAVGAGMGRIGLSERPKELNMKQAVAAVGQAILMQLYQKFLVSIIKILPKYCLQGMYLAVKLRKIMLTIR